MREEKLLTYLKDSCAGRSRAVKGAELERVLHISGTDLRKLINRLRRKGIPIGSSRNGYFYAKTAGEVYSTMRHLGTSIRGMQAAYQGLEGALDTFSTGGDASG